ncbi:GNAT family N-acetyltransferase [Nocardia sp. NPDC051832]|uniref:GNAT family N-acetyltransferase n=1 Tax=Nocardia sp. NPDC051832 TaxID=3155673 RepID=UPI0034242501
MFDVSLRPAASADLPFIGMLCARSTSISEEGLGYPRCDDESELLAELALYGNKFEQHVFIVEDVDGTAIGFGGYLISDTDSACYLIAPLLDRRYRTVDTATRAVEQLVAQPIAAPKQVSYLEESNLVLAEALLRAGWERGSAQLEMCCALSAANRGDMVSGYPVRTVESKSDPLFADIAEMLAEHHHWTSDPLIRLSDYVADGYQVSVIELDVLAACALWIRVADTAFGRLDYLSVAEAWRGKSLGTALTKHVLAEAVAVGGIEKMYLSVDPGNEAARRVYRACGFVDGTVSRQYRYAPGPV